MTKFTQEDWPFIDPQNVAVLTTIDIVSQQKPILYASHDSDDGTWQFHSGEQVLEDESQVVSLSKIVTLDPSVKDLASLPLGWIATRKSLNTPWQYYEMNNLNR